MKDNKIPSPLVSLLPVFVLILLGTYILNYTNCK